MIFMLLMHMYVVLPYQLKHMSSFQLCFVVKRCCQEPLHTSSFAKRRSQNWLLWWCSKSLIKIELDELQIQMSNIILSFLCKLIFFSCFLQWLLKPVFLHYLIQKGKGLEGQEVISLVKKKKNLQGCSFAGNKEEGVILYQEYRQQSQHEISQHWGRNFHEELAALCFAQCKTHGWTLDALNWAKHQK